MISSRSTRLAVSTPRTPAQLRALRTRVMVLAWRKARALVALRPTLNLMATMRDEMAGAWTKARQEERNGWLRPADTPPASPTRPGNPIRAEQIRVAIADLETRDRLGPALLGRLQDLGRELVGACAG